MCSVPSPRAGVAAVGGLKGVASVFKDIHRISVGDCALFEPSQDSPPFIGIIRSLGSDKENLQLGVNWLYRPADVKLVKGVALEAAPNEVFYSFRTDEIPAVSLLHPCKVAFLPKGVELPSGVSSFVCRRVYDTTNNRLWWLTDREFINDQQEEVDQLLHKTQFEMHATVQQQQGVRSPKLGSSPMSTSQLKHSPDSGQNSATTFPAYPKGKKRERSDQLSEPTKRERTSRSDDGDSGLLRAVTTLKSEIAKITDNGGLVDSAGVERLVQLIHPDKSDKRIDLTCRSLLTGVIASTDKDDCLCRFVQLRGLPVLDEWLQDVHKGKIGNSSSPRDHDRSVEDFLLVLLRALDKLPVNLNALQMCNIGKSVNHLRSHRNSEIQKKARSLVETWKRRVEAEMNSNDVKSGSSQAVTWTARTRNEVPHGSNRNTVVPLDTSTRNSVPLQSPKSPSVKVVPGEAVGKTTYVSASNANVKLVSSPASTGPNIKDGHLRPSVISGTSEPPQSFTRDDKSSSSSPSHTNSQCSSDQAKNPGLAGKEDTRSSNSGSTSLNKGSGSASRRRKSANGLQCSLPASNIPRDGGSSRNSSLTRVSGAEKLSHSPAACERSVDVPVSDSNNHKLIVKISNRGRSPLQIVNGCSMEDALLTNSRACSPEQPEKYGPSDRSSKDRNDGCRNNTLPDTNSESWQSNDLKDEVIRCGEGCGSPALAPDFGRSHNDEETRKLANSKSETKPGKLRDSSLSSINALIESCVNYSEGIASMSSGDDGGMNLLASVAAGEISTPAHSPQGSASVADETVRSKHHADVDISGQDHIQSSNADIEAPKPSIAVVALQAYYKHDQGKDLLHDVDMSLRFDGKTNESVVVASVLPSSICAEGGEDAAKVQKSKESVKDDGHVRIPDKRQDATKDKGTSLYPKNGMKDGPSCNTSVDEPASRIEKVATSSSCLVSNLLPGQLSDAKDDDDDDEEEEEEEGCEFVDQEASKTVEPEKDSHPVPHKQEEAEFESDLTDQEPKDHEEDIGNKVIVDELADKVSSPASPEKHLCSDAKNSKLAGEEVMEGRACGDEGTSSPAAESSGTGGRFEFDLNEGFNMDDSKDENLLGGSTPGCLSSFRFSHLPTLSSTTACGNSVPSSVTVTSAAKGAFVPPQDLLRNKGELGWKGSAATSAFRPAEPRKISELPLSSNVSPFDTSAGKKGRVLFEIDLNVADESIMEDMGQSSYTKHDRRDQCGASTRFAGGFDLDLNTVEEASELAQHPPSFHRSETRLQPLKLSSSSRLASGESARRDFDLNNGPASDEVTVDSSFYNLHGRPNIPLQPSIGFRLNSTDVGNLNSWYPTGSPFSAIPIPTPLPDMERQSFPIMGTSGGTPRMLCAPTGTMPFHPDMYRGSVLSSSPAVPFPGAPFQYPVFPFGTSFPLPSSSLPGGSAAFLDLSSGGRLCIPAVPSQLVGSVSSQYAIPRPYVGLSDVAIENTRKWGRQGLDLNAGPGCGLELEGRDETFHIPPSRAVSTMGSLSLADEQSRMMYPMAGGVLKRKEPDGGWDADRLSGYMQQPSWQ